MSIATKCTCGYSITGVCTSSVKECRQLRKENTQLPVEAKQKIWFEAEKYTEGKVKAINEEHFNVYNAYIEGATAYATKLHQLQQVTTESDKQRKEANDQLREAKKLLNEVFRKHEAGLLPDRFIYEKIKTFLYGE